MSWNIRVKTLFLNVILFLVVFCCYSQEAVIQVIKKSCTYDAKYSGSKLLIRYTLDTVKIESSIEYWLQTFIDFPDSIKLKIIGSLLEYENDTSLCCMSVINRSFNGIEGCGGRPKGVNRYTIQVDALFMINRLCWPKLMELYSCTPVLYDNRLNKSINDDQKKIRLVFGSYVKWYKECVKKGQIGKYFPFNDGRYTWYGGRKSISPKGFN